MSIKLQLKYRFRSVRQFVESFTMPSWVFSGWTKSVMASLILVVGVGYMFQINSLSTSGYVVNNLEKKLASVNDDIQKLNSELASAQSLGSVQARVGSLSMVTASQIQYVKSAEKTAFAR